MRRPFTTALLAICAGALLTTTWTGLRADSTAYATDPKSVPGANGSSGADLGLAFFAIADANVDNSVSRAELKSTLEKFLADAGNGGVVTAEQLQAGVKLFRGDD